MLLGPSKNAGVKPDAKGEDSERGEEEVQGERGGEADAAPRDEEHNLQMKSSKRRRGFRKDNPVAPADAGRVKKLLGVK